MTQTVQIESGGGAASKNGACASSNAIEPMARLGARLGMNRGSSATTARIGDWRQQDQEARIRARRRAGARRRYARHQRRLSIQPCPADGCSGGAMRAGLHCVLDSPAPDRPAHYFGSGNLLLDRLLGAHIHVAPLDAGGKCGGHAVADLRPTGRKPYVVPLGCSDHIGSVGYVLAASELIAQCADNRGFEPRAVVLVTGSAGTRRNAGRPANAAAMPGRCDRRFEQRAIGG